MSLTTRLAAVAVIAIGLLVLVGWTLDLAFLKGPVPGLVQMKANTAIGLLAMGFSLFLLTLTPSDGLRRAAGVAGGVAVLIGALTIVEYVVGRNLGIDEVMFRDVDAVATVHPGRLAPQTAIDFLCLGSALVAMSGRRARHSLVDAFTGLGLVIALFAVLGYAYGASSLHKLPSLTPMALHTAIACLILCIGVAASHSGGFFVSALTGHRSGSVAARRLLPFVLLMPVLGWLRLKGETAGLYSLETGVALLVLICSVVFAVAILYLARTLNRVDAERERTLAVEHRLAALVEASSEAILSADPEGTITSWNPAAERLYGYRADEILGSPLTMLIPPARIGDRERLFEAALAGQQVAGYDTQRVHKDGSILDVAVTAAPIKEGKRVVGACAITHDISERLRARELLEATVHERTAELASSREETLKCLALAAEYRDDDTARHTERVGVKAALVASRLGLPSSFVTLIRQAAPLHDVGKIGIRDEILLKPGKLTDEEFEAMKRHTVMGGALLSGSGSEILQLAEQIAVTHHERWDGKGYPAGLAGEEIPIAGRILAVVDSFDAMTHDRPYRRGSCVDDALSEITRCCGTQFDPAVVAALLELSHEELSDASRSDCADNAPSVPDTSERSRCRQGVSGRVAKVALDLAVSGYRP